MRIAISLTDQDFEHTKSVGILRVSLGLAKGLAAHPEVEALDLLLNSGLDPEQLPQESSKIRHHLTDKPVPKRLGRVLWDQMRVTQAVDKLDSDWLVLPKGFPPRLGWPRCKVCCYIHDYIFSYYANRPDNPFPHFERLYFPPLIKRALRRADLVVTNSEFSRRSLEALGGDASVENIGIGFDDPPAKAPAQGGGILLLTSKLPHKLSLQAVAWLDCWDIQTENERPIHLVGGLPQGVHVPDRPHWHKHARLDFDAYAALKRKCAALLYFSAYEGFGMPPVEALREGLPAVASDLPPHRENLPAEILFDNDDYRDFASKLERQLTQPLIPPLKLPDWGEVAARLVQAMRAAD